MSTPEKALVLTKKHISALNPVAVAMDPAVRNQFVNKFVQMFQVPQAEAIRFYDRESDNFSRMVSQSEALRTCTPMSLYMAFMKVGALKLTFDNGRKPLIYLIPGNRNVGTKDKPQWVKEVAAQPTPEGEKEVRVNNGILKKVGHPIIIHHGDVYREFLNSGGELTIEWEGLNKSTKIIGSFIRLVEPDGTVVFKTFKPNDWERMKAASAKKNKGVANALYTAGTDGQIDEGFLKGKTLLHAFHGYKQVNFLYTQPEGFTPDTKAAVEINASYMDDLTIDTDFEEEKETPAKDEFTQIIQEEEEVKPGLTVDEEDDDPFSAK